jgi:hypothetical protein
MKTVRSVRVVPGDLLGAQEAAEFLGVHQSNLRAMVGLPEPFRVLAMGSIWLRDDLVAFQQAREENPPRPGRKPQSAINN